MNKKLTSVPPVSLTPKAPLVVPIGPDWTKKKDKDEFVARFGDPEKGQSHRDFGFDQVLLATRQLDYLLSRAVHHAASSKDVSITSVAALSFDSKCRLLEDLVTTKKPDEKLRQDFLESLDYCRRAVELKEDVLAKNALHPELIWLLELADAADHQSTAQIELDDTLSSLGFPDHDWLKDLPEFILEEKNILAEAA